MPKIILDDDPNDIGWVYSIMLFPNDETLRKQNFGLEIAKLELLKVEELQKRWMSPQGEELQPALDTKKITTLLINTPADSDFKIARTEREKKGTVAGQILASLYLMDKFNLEEPSLNKAIFVSTEYNKKAKFGDGSPMPAESKIKEYWKEYLPVAHLWAAFELNINYSFVSEQHDCFGEKGFIKFLQVAADIYNFGIKFIPKRARPLKPILNAEKCWGFDSSIKPLTLISDIKPQSLIKILKKYKAPKTVI